MKVTKKVVSLLVACSAILSLSVGTYADEVSLLEGATLQQNMVVNETTATVTTMGENGFISNLANTCTHPATHLMSTGDKRSYTSRHRIIITNTSGTIFYQDCDISGIEGLYVKVCSLCGNNVGLDGWHRDTAIHHNAYCPQH